MQVFVIEPNGDARAEKVDELTLDNLRGWVGGHIEPVMFPALSVAGYVNEEGKLDGLPYNARATELYLASWIDAGYPAPADVLVGPVVVVGEVDDFGNEVGLSDVQVARLARYVSGVTL